MLSLLGLSFLTRVDEEPELTPEQQDAADAFREKFFLYLSFGTTAMIVVGAGISYVVGLIS